LHVSTKSTNFIAIQNPIFV